MTERIVDLDKTLYELTAQYPELIDRRGFEST